MKDGNVPGGQFYPVRQSLFSVFQYLHGIGIEASVLATSCQPKIIGHEVSADESCLLAFHYHYRDAWVQRKKMFAKQTLPKMEIRQSHFRVCPTDVCSGLLDTVSIIIPIIFISMVNW